MPDEDAIAEAAAFLLELVEADLLPVELNDDARRLSAALHQLARDLDGG